MRKQDQLCDIYFILGILQREHYREKWVAYIYLLFRFKIYIFCAPRNPIYIIQHRAGKLKKFNKWLNISYSFIIFTVRLEPRLKHIKDY